VFHFKDKVLGPNVKSGNKADLTTSDKHTCLLHKSTFKIVSSQENDIDKILKHIFIIKDLLT